MQLYDDDDHQQHGSLQQQCLLQRRSWELDNNLNHQIMDYHHVDMLSANVDGTLTSGANYYNDNNLGCYDSYNFVSETEGFSSDFGRDIGSYMDMDGYQPWGGNQFKMVSESLYDQPAQFSAPTTVAETSLYEGYPIFSTMEEEEEEILTDEVAAGLEMLGRCKTEPVVSPDQNVAGQVQDDVREMKISGRKRVEGQPSKNLMAERRRRKRLNDRLSMLRSIVPKISKMDRTSILGDTIDYMKELLDKIQKLQEEIMESGSNQKLNMVQLLNDMKSNEMVVRNSPKFNVERRDDEGIRVEMCCSGKPSLLLSTVNTLEGFGVEIQQCVISCFNDFALQASCSQVTNSIHPAYTATGLNFKLQNFTGLREQHPGSSEPSILSDKTDYAHPNEDARSLFLSKKVELLPFAFHLLPLVL